MPGGFVNSPSVTCELGCFPKASLASGPSAASFSDLVEKAQAVFQGLTLFGHTVDFTEALKIVMGALLTPGATWIKILEAVIANRGTIFPPALNLATDEKIEDHVRKMWSVAE
jgi:hypothetical protein